MKRELLTLGCAGLVALVSATSPAAADSSSGRVTGSNIDSVLLSAAVAPKTILITSAITGEGKTTTSVNLAIILARQGRRVLLVDADLRRRVRPSGRRGVPGGGPHARRACRSGQRSNRVRGNRSIFPGRNLLRPSSTDARCRALTSAALSCRRPPRTGAGTPLSPPRPRSSRPSRHPPPACRAQPACR